MSWPTMSDYQEAVQNPKNCFSDRELQGGTATLNALGLPQPVTGGFCSVYQITTGKTRWAVRCFLHNIKDIRDRYSQISRYLKSKRVKHMVGFGYVEEGIRVRGTWYPVLKMEWVDGFNLDRWVENHLRDGRALRKFSERFAEMMDELEKAKIGHCDLQHGNVLVDGGNNIRLIDYDGMYVPPLRGRGSHEKGHPAYQHPEREGRDFDESVDRFSALVIQASVLALAEKPDLWKKYNEEDNLIFKRADFQSPDSAPVFDDLDKMGGTVAALSRALRESCKAKVGKAPRLSELMNGKAKLSLVPDPAKASAPAPAPAPQAARPAPSAPARAPAPAPPPPRPAPAASAPARASAPAPPPPRPAAAPSAPAKPVPKVIPFPAAASGGGGKKNKSRRAKSAPASAPAQPAWSGGGSPRGKSRRAVATATAAATAPAPQAHSQPAPKPALAVVAQARPGWTVEWKRPGEAIEKHTWKVPVYGQRQGPAFFLGLKVGTRTEKFVENYEEKVEERRSFVGGHRAAVTSLTFSPDGSLLVSGSRDRTVRVWNTKSGREAVAPLDTRASVVAVALVADRSVVAAALDDRRIVLWDFGLHRAVTHFGSPDRKHLGAIAVSKDGKLVAAGGHGRTIYVWQTDRGTLANEFRYTIGRVEALAFTPDGGGVVCGTHKGRIELYERGHDEARWSVRTGLGRIVALAAPPRTAGALSGGAGGTVAFWDLKDGSEKQRVQPMRGRLTALATTPDAAYVLVGLSSGKACLTERATDREVAVLDGHAGAITAAALSGTGKHAATGASDGSVRLWAAP